MPDLVSFYRYGIEFQTNTVAREPGVLEVTQLKSLDDTAHCSSTTDGDTLLFKVYVKGLKPDQENAESKNGPSSLLQIQGYLWIQTLLLIFLERTFQSCLLVYKY